MLKKTRKFDLKKILLLSFILLNKAIAAPAPFGLEIGKTTLSEAQKKYPLQKSGSNKWTQGPMFKINPSNIQFDGLKSIELIFSKENKLLAVLTSLHKGKFYALQQQLQKKYKLISQSTPSVGNKNAKFVEENVEIFLEAPHMSFDMSMNYIDKEFYSVYETAAAQEKQKQHEKEAAQL